VTTDSTDRELGPIDYLVVEFPGDGMNGEGLPILVDLVDRGIITLLDLVFLTKDADGTVTRVELNELEGFVELDVFDGASSGLLADDDVVEAGNALEPNTSAVLLVYENAWAGPLAAAVRRNGGELVAFGRIPTQEILARLDELDALVEA
jgi:hypothetical protein